MPNGHGKEEAGRLEQLYQMLDPTLRLFVDEKRLYLITVSREYAVRAITNFDERREFILGYGEDRIYRKVEIDSDDNLEKPTLIIRGYEWLGEERLRHLKIEELGRWPYNLNNLKELTDILISSQELVFLRWTIEDLTQKVPLRSNSLPYETY